MHYIIEVNLNRIRKQAGSNTANQWTHSDFRAKSCVLNSHRSCTNEKQAKALLKIVHIKIFRLNSENFLSQIEWIFILTDWQCCISSCSSSSIYQLVYHQQLLARLLSDLAQVSLGGLLHFNENHRRDFLREEGFHFRFVLDLTSIRSLKTFKRVTHRAAERFTLRTLHYNLKF